MVEVGDKVFVTPLYGQKDNLAVIGGAGGGITEGDYNTWTMKWGWTLPNGRDSYPPGPALYIDETNDIFYMWWTADSPNKYRFGTYNIADHSTVFESPSDIDYVCSGAYCGGAGDYTIALDCHSLDSGIARSHQTYILLSRLEYVYYSHTIEIWRAGVKLWSRDMRLDTEETYGEPQQTYFSLSGKYILIFEYYSQKLWLYEGSKV